MGWSERSSSSFNITPEVSELRRISSQPIMKSQQKCIVIFALVGCCAVLIALIFSAVDVWGDDDDGITEDNCSRTCRFVLVENIPEDVSIPYKGTIPLNAGLHELLDQAHRFVEIVSPWWSLNSSKNEFELSQAKQGEILFHQLTLLRSRSVGLRVVSGISDSSELNVLEKHGAEVHFVNMKVMTKGQMNSSFWVVDRKHMYIGSAGMDWRSFSTMKEFGIIIYNCSCLVMDLHRIFSLYRHLQYKEFVPPIWSKKLTALYNKDKSLQLFLNDTKAKAYISGSPDVFCPKERMKDIEAIFKVIQEAKTFIYISVPNYLPILKITQPKYWSQIDNMLREALVLKNNMKVRLLMSCWEQTDPLTFSFVWSLKSLCMDSTNCSLEAKFFIQRKQSDRSLYHNRYMVTDNSVYLGNFNWVANEFVFNAGVGIVINQQSDVNFTVVDTMKAVFERDWNSQYSKTLQPNKIPACIKHTTKEHTHDTWTPALHQNSKAWK